MAAARPTCTMPMVVASRFNSTKEHICRYDTVAAISATNATHPIVLSPIHRSAPGHGFVQQIANSRKQRPETVEDVLARLERSGLVQSAAALRTT